MRTRQPACRRRRAEECWRWQVDPETLLSEAFASAARLAAAKAGLAQEGDGGAETKSRTQQLLAASMHYARMQVNLTKAEQGREQAAIKIQARARGMRTRKKVRVGAAVLRGRRSCRSRPRSLALLAAACLPCSDSRARGNTAQGAQGEGASGCQNPGTRTGYARPQRGAVVGVSSLLPAMPPHGSLALLAAACTLTLSLAQAQREGHEESGQESAAQGGGNASPQQPTPSAAVALARLDAALLQLDAALVEQYDRLPQAADVDRTVEGVAVAAVSAVHAADNRESRVAHCEVADGDGRHESGGAAPEVSEQAPDPGPAMEDEAMAAVPAVEMSQQAVDTREAPASSDDVAGDHVEAAATTNDDQQKDVEDAGAQNAASDEPERVGDACEAPGAPTLSHRHESGGAAPEVSEQAPDPGPAMEDEAMAAVPAVEMSQQAVDTREAPASSDDVAGDHVEAAATTKDDQQKDVEVAGAQNAASDEPERGGDACEAPGGEAISEEMAALQQAFAHEEQPHASASCASPSNTELYLAEVEFCTTAEDIARCVIGYIDRKLPLESAEVVSRAAGRHVARFCRARLQGHDYFKQVWAMSKLQALLHRRLRTARSDFLLQRRGLSVLQSRFRSYSASAGFESTCEAVRRQQASLRQRQARNMYAPLLAHRMECRRARSFLFYCLMRTKLMARREIEGYANARLQAALRCHLMHAYHQQSCQAVKRIQAAIRKCLSVGTRGPPQPPDEICREVLESVFELVAEEIELRRDPHQSRRPHIRATGGPYQGRSRSALMSRGRVLQVFLSPTGMGRYAAASERAVNS